VITILQADRLSVEGFHGLKITGEARKSDEIVQQRSVDWAADFPVGSFQKPPLVLPTCSLSPPLLERSSARVPYNPAFMGI
jgi:hypothetical protein